MSETSSQRSQGPGCACASSIYTNLATSCHEGQTRVWWVSPVLCGEVNQVHNSSG
jgi:hypothetical protein